MTNLQATKIFASIMAAYSSNKFTEDSVGVYSRMLGDLDYATANAATEQLIAISKWPPTVADIRERCAALTHGEVKAGGEAWGEVLRAIGRYGRNRTPGVDFAWSDPALGEAVSAMSWRELCDSDNQIADRARFIDVYDAIAVKHRREQVSGCLPAVQQLRALRAAEQAPMLRDGKSADIAPRSTAQLVEGVMLHVVRGRP